MDNDKLKQYRKEYYQKNKERLLNKAKKYSDENGEKIKEFNRQYYLNNKEKRKLYRAEYRLKNSEKIKDSIKKYYENNKEKFKGYQKDKKDYNNQYYKARKKNDPVFNLKTNLRSRLSKAFKIMNYSKNSSTQKALGESFEFVKNYIEIQFKKGMNWDNYGEWHIDHKIPLSYAKTEEQLIKLFHYTNLQPLWAIDNLEKSNNIVEHQIKLI